MQEITKKEYEEIFGGQERSLFAKLKKEITGLKVGTGLKVEKDKNIRVYVSMISRELGYRLTVNQLPTKDGYVIWRKS